MPSQASTDGSNLIVTGPIYANLRPTPDMNGPITKYTFPGGTFALTDNSPNYLIATYNSGSPILQMITDPTIWTESDNTPIYSCFRKGSTVKWLSWDTVGYGKVDKINKRLARTQKFVQESGVILGEAATRQITLTAGKIWYGALSTDVSSFVS